MLKVLLVLVGNRKTKINTFMHGYFSSFYHHLQWKLCNQVLMDLVLQHCCWGGVFLSGIMWCCLGFITSYLRNTGPAS